MTVTAILCTRCGDGVYILHWRKTGNICEQCKREIDASVLLAGDRVYRPKAGETLRRVRTEGAR